MKNYKLCEHARKGMKDSRNYYICKLEGNCPDMVRVSSVVTYCSRALRRVEEPYELGADAMPSPQAFMERRFKQRR